MKKNIQRLKSFWSKRLIQELPQYNRDQHDAMITWLLQENNFLDIQQKVRIDELNRYSTRLEYRYSLLRYKYLDINSLERERGLICRLELVVSQFSAFLSIEYCQKFQQSMFSLLKKVLQEMISNDPYIKKQFAKISEETCDQDLREALSLATLEEYCLYTLKSKPLFLYSLRQHLIQQPLTSCPHLLKLRCFNKTDNFSDLMQKITVFR